MNRKNISVPRLTANPESRRLWRGDGALFSMMVGIVMLYFLGIGMGGGDAHAFAWIGFMGMTFAICAAARLITHSLWQDQQANVFETLRFGALTSWQMTWPRLMVVPVIAWFTFLIGLLSYICGIIISRHPSDDEYFLLGLLLHNIFIRPDEINHPIAVLVLFALCWLLFAWVLVCVHFINALQAQRDPHQWTGNAYQLILLYLMGRIFVFDFMADPSIPHHFNTTIHGFILSLPKEPLDLLLYCSISGVLLAILATWGASSAMAQKLHRPVYQAVWLTIALLLPLTLWWLGLQGNALLLQFGLGYGLLALISLVTQDSRPMALQLAAGCWRQGLQRLPAWMVLLPLGLCCTLIAMPTIAHAYVNHIVFALIIFGLTRYAPIPLNRISLGMTVFLLLRFVYAYFLYTVQ